MDQSDFEKDGSCIVPLFAKREVPLLLNELIQDEELSHAVERLLGRSGTYVRGRIRGKIAGSKGRDWHRDEDGESRGADVIVVLAVTRLTLNNGTVEYLPGSHRAGVDQAVTDLAQTITPVRLELAPGFAWIHKVRLLHRTLPNTSDDTQVLAVLRFSPG